MWSRPRSPDGKFLAYESAGDRDDFMYRNTVLAVVPVEGGEPRVLTADFDESPNLHAGDRLDVRGHALGEPGVVFLERGMREMNHLVSHHPIAREIFGGSIAADGEANERVSVGRVTLADLAGSAGQDLYLGLAHREAAVVRGDGAPCRGDPSD